MFRRLTKETRVTKNKTKNRAFRAYCFKKYFTVRFLAKNKPWISKKTIDFINIETRIVNKFINGRNKSSKRIHIRNKHECKIFAL